MVCNVVFISGVQQSDPVTHTYTHTHTHTHTNTHTPHTHIYILYQILFHYGLLQDIELSTLSYIQQDVVVSIIYIVVCIC